MPSDAVRTQSNTDTIVHQMTPKFQQFFYTIFSDVFEHFSRRTDEIESYDNEKQARRHADVKDRLSLMQLMDLKD